MKLFLAEMIVETSEYMGRSSRCDVRRIVWASSEDDAVKKLKAAIEKDDPYGTSFSINHVELSEAIV